jgi:amidase
MDYSAAVIPVTKADKRVDTFNQNYEPLSDIDRKNWAACKSTLSNPFFEVSTERVLMTALR